MFRLGRQVESALMAFDALGKVENSKGLSISEICTPYGLSKNTLSKVMQSLLSDGLLKSSQGAKGGYRLKKPLHEISFYQLLTSLGELKQLACRDNSPCNLSKTCEIKSPLLRWEASFESYLKQTKLSDLLDNHTEGLHDH